MMGYPRGGVARTDTPNKKPGQTAGLLICCDERARGLRGLVGDRSAAIGLVAIALGVRIAFAFGGFGLGAGAARALGELGLDLLDRFGLSRVLHHRNLAGETVERGFIELAFAVGLLRLRLGAIEVAHDFRDR